MYSLYVSLNSDLSSFNSIFVFRESYSFLYFLFSFFLCLLLMFGYFILLSRSIGGEVSTDGDFLIFEGNRYNRKGFLFKSFAMSAIVSLFTYLFFVTKVKIVHLFYLRVNLACIIFISLVNNINIFVVVSQYKIIKQCRIVK